MQPMSANNTSYLAAVHQPAFRAALTDLCLRYHIRKLAFFGSVLRPDFGPHSDIDVLVEFDPGQTPGFAFFSIQDELTALLGRQVDLHTPNSLSPYFRKQVEATADVHYSRS
jgi:predicted nucleotidyltransferase